MMKLQFPKQRNIWKKKASR